MRGRLLTFAFVALLVSGLPAKAQAAPGQTSTITLHVTDSGTPFAGAVAAEHWVDGHSERVEAPFDGDGTAVLTLADGQWILSLLPADDGAPRPYGFLEVAGDLDAAIDLRAKEPTVPVDISVVDASTQELLSGGELAILMVFGDQQCVGTRQAPGGEQPPISGQPPSGASEPCDLQWAEPGRLVGKVPPGLLHVQALPEEVTCADTPHEGQHPCWHHVPRSVSLVAVEGTPLDATIPLLAVPAPDAFVEGYLVSNVTGQPIPHKHVEFQGTGDYARVTFSAAVDGNGSYRVGIPAGSYSSWAWVCGHDELVTPFQLAAGQTLRLDLHLAKAGMQSEAITSSSSSTSSTSPATPTETASDPNQSYGSSRTSANASSWTTPLASGMPPAAREYPACDADSTAEPVPEQGGGDGGPVIQMAGLLAFVDYGGGLGPIGGPVVGEGPSGHLSSAPAHGLPLALWPLLGGLALAVLALRRRRS